MTNGSALSRFRHAYGEHRAAEGRRLSSADSLTLPYLDTGPFADQWSVRARTFDAFMTRVLTPLADANARRVRLLDVGAGNGWLCWRATRAGVDAIAVDIRDDDVDGLGAAAPYFVGASAPFGRAVATFDALPLCERAFDVVVFNASLHYATDLRLVLSEARRVARDGGRIVVLDSPFYGTSADGDAMVADKARAADERFGARAMDLMSIPCIEYLTEDRLRAACDGLGITWQQHPVAYPAWYEARALVAARQGERAPSRFALWEGVVA